MIHVKFIQRPNVLNKYKTNQNYHILNMNDNHNSINIFQLYDTKNHKDAFKKNLGRLSQIYLLLTHQRKISKARRTQLVKKFRLLMVGFYHTHGFMNSHYQLKPLNYKNNDFPTIPVFSQFINEKFKTNVHKPNTLSFLETIELAFNNISSNYANVSTHYTHLTNSIDDALSNHHNNLIIDLTPFYQKHAVGMLYSIALTAIAFFHDYGTKHPNLPIQLNLVDLMKEPHFDKKSQKARHVTNNNKHSSRSLKYENNHNNSNEYVPRHSSDIDEHVGNNERKSTVMSNDQEDLVKNMYFADLIKHQFGKAENDLKQLKHSLSTADYQLLTSDLASQKEAYRKFGDDLTNIAEKLFD